MSKIANRSVLVPPNVKVILHKEKISVEGPLGKNEINFPSGLEVINKESKISTKSDNSENIALVGTYNSLIYNAIRGVTEGYQEVLEVKGIGYKVSLKDNKLEFLLGKSHPILLDIPKGLEVKAEGNKIMIKGVNKQQVRKFAVNDIRALRLPSIYKKAKGIYYVGEEESIKLKPGKSLNK